jgi:hypothetical protein
VFNQELRHKGVLRSGGIADCFLNVYFPSVMVNKVCSIRNGKCYVIRRLNCGGDMCEETACLSSSGVAVWNSCTGDIPLITYLTYWPSV